MTDARRRWADAPGAVLSYLDEVASHSDVAGYEIRPLPDKVHVLHPLFERSDGGPIDDADEPWADGREFRRLRWRDYAQRRGIPLVRNGGYPAIQDGLPGVWDDDHVYPPSEGDIEDERTRTALYRILAQYTADGPEEQCTAWWYDFWIDLPPGGGDPVNVMRGPLGAWNELYDRDDRRLGPQVLWPDDHTWIVSTHTDSWATTVSGPTALIEALIADTALEATRMHWLD